MKKMRSVIFLLFALGLLIWNGCRDREDDFITDGSVELRFSLDTLRFDTVFTELGSATRYFKVYNPNSRPLRLDKVYLKGGEQSPFRLNVDGLPGKSVDNVEIWGGDSIYVFVEVTVDPDQPLSVSPFVIEDQVVLQSADREQEVRLEAWGQNANYYPSRYNKGVPVLLTCDNGIIRWDDPKPYVIFGEIFIDSCALEMAAGTRVYVHGGIAKNDVFDVFNDGIIYTLEKGSIRLQGEPNNPVIIQGDRLEEDFQDQPGQWYGIILGRGSKGNQMDYAVIRNSLVGIYADSTSELTASHTQIYNTNSNGLLAFHAKATMTNCLFYNHANNAVQILLGGDYLFEHCTIASYGVDASALGMSNYYCYDNNPLSCEINKTYRLNATFRNCILFGSSRDELELSDFSGRQTPAQFNVQFDHCVVKVDQLLTNANSDFQDFLTALCSDCINGKREDKLFLDPSEDDFHLDTLSIAKDKGLVLPNIPDDLEGKPRDNMPDIGCFEYVD